jgi:hypothetical protein
VHNILIGCLDEEMESWIKIIDGVLRASLSEEAVQKKKDAAKVRTKGSPLECHSQPFDRSFYLQACEPHFQKQIQQQLEQYKYVIQILEQSGTTRST